MKLLIVAATKGELGKTFDYFNLQDKNYVDTHHFDVLITGVGMTATAFALGKHLKETYNLVLNVGIAGSFDQNIPLGSLVSLSSDTFSELGAEDHDRFLPIEELGFGKSSYSATASLSGLPTVNGITVNKVHGNRESIDKIQHRLDVQVESMEGAAVFYACHESNIPCAQVRSISNYVMPRAKENWEIALAINNLNDWLIKFIVSKEVK